MLTYLDVLKIFKEAPNKVDYLPQGDCCMKLAETFATGEGLSDDVCFAAEMKRRIEEGTLTELQTFKNFTEEEARQLVESGYTLHRFKGKLAINPSQKWHLYVSYIAYQEVAAMEIFNTKVTKIPGSSFSTTPWIFSKMVRQREYIRWVKESLGLVTSSSWEDVEKVCESILSKKPAPHRA